MGASTKRIINNRIKPPRHLKGREIGLFYKELSQKRKSDEKFSKNSVNGGRVVFSKNLIETIEEKLSTNEQESFCQGINVKFENYFKEVTSLSFQDVLIDKTRVFKEQNFGGSFNENIHIQRELTEIQRNLPVFNYSETILKSVSENTFVLISGDTGCGKTTQIPQIILDDQINRGCGLQCNIICTQPRRISAISVAERVAYERNEKLGVSVGYQVRLDSCLPRPYASILYCTTGTLLRRLEGDPSLPKVSHIILDEIHERNIESDILIGLLDQITKYNKDLKVLLMSATFGIEDFAKHFKNTGIIQIEGTLFPVKVNYMEDILEEIKFFDFPNKKSISKNKPKYLKYLKAGRAELAKTSEFEDFINPYARILEGKYSSKVINAIKNPMSEEINFDLLKALVLHIDSTKEPGAILIFFPGYDKISKFHNILTLSNKCKNMLIFPLHSMMPTLEQKEIFAKPKEGFRKIILATNIAETSITIDDVVYVINTGKVKYKDYNISKNYSTLEEYWVTIAHSKQRQGRAGRCQPGICYNLYTKARECTLEYYPLPEILRSRLECIILNLKMLRIHNIKEFMSTLINPPPETSIENGIQLLKRLNALDELENITPLGLHLAKLPIDPQIGKMILFSAIFQCVDPIASIAATLSFKEPFYRPIGKEKDVDKVKKEFASSYQSDHRAYNVVMQNYKHLTMENLNKFYLAPSILKQIEQMKTQLCDILYSAGFVNNANIKASPLNRNSSCEHLLNSIITAGLYPNVAVVKKSKLVGNRVKPRTHIETLEDGLTVKIHPSSVNFETNFHSKFLVYFKKQKTSDLFLYDTTTVDNPIPWLILGDQILTEKSEDQNDKWSIFLANKSLQFESDEATKKIILKLRNHFETFLRDLALNPTAISDNKESAKNLIEALMICFEAGIPENIEI